MTYQRLPDGRIDFLSLFEGGRTGVLVEIGKRLYEARMNVRASREVVANYSGVAEDVLTKIELGQADIQDKSLIKICRSVGTTIDCVVPEPSLDEATRKAVCEEITRNNVGMIGMLADSDNISLYCIIRTIEQLGEPEKQAAA